MRKKKLWEKGEREREKARKQDIAALYRSHFFEENPGAPVAVFCLATNLVFNNYQVTGRKF